MTKNDKIGNGELENHKTIGLAEIQRKLDFFSKYPNNLLYQGKEVFGLCEQVDSYLSQPFASREEKQKAHGNFVWMLKNYYSTPFQQEAIALQNMNVASLDLTDKDKLNYLNYILTMKNYTRFSPRFFNMLSKYNPESDASSQQSGRVFYRIQALLAKNYKKDENYQQAALRFYPFLCSYAQNCPQITYKLIDNYADMLFRMSSKFSKQQQRVSLMPLKDLMERMAEQRRKRSETKSLFGDEFEPEQPAKPQIDKTAVRNVLTKYAEYSLQAEQKGKFDAILYSSMKNMLCFIVENYDYSAADIRALRRDLGRDSGVANQRGRLYKLGLEAQRKYSQLHPERRRKPKAVDLSKTVMDYYFEH